MKPTGAEELSSGASRVQDLDVPLVGSLAWTAGVKWATQLITWASFLVVARLLAPSDFGLVGMALIYLELVELLSEFGIGTAIVTLHELDDEQIAQINTISLLFGFVALAISCVAANPLGHFFRTPQLPRVVVVMSLGFAVGAFRPVPFSLLQKDLRFKLLSLIEGVQGISQALSTVILALLGLGYWALVLGRLVATTVAALMPLLWRAHGFRWPRFHAIKHALAFSWKIIVTRLSWYGYSNSDFLVAGRVLGKAPLGAYSLAWDLASLPVEKMTALVTRVTPAFFSAVQTDLAALRRYLRTLTEGLALVTFPATFGLALVANEFVPLVLGKKWAGATVPLELLALYASLRSIVTLLPQVLTVVGESGFVMWSTLLALFVLPPVFYVGSQWGTVGIATGWIVVYPFLTLPLYRRTFRRIKMPVKEYLGAVRPALTAGLVMALCVLAVKWLLSSAWPLYLRFGLEVVAGGAAYLLAVAALHWDRVQAFVGLVKQLRS